MAKTIINEKEALELLKSRGYQVKKPGKYVKATFQVHPDTLSEFKKCAAAAGYMLQDAVTEAFDNWVEWKEKRHK